MDLLTRLKALPILLHCLPHINLPEVWWSNNKLALSLSLSAAATATAKSLQSCPTLCDPIDLSPPGCPVPGILQARTLEWVAISFSNAWKRKVKVKSLSRVRLFATPWTAAHQAPPSLGFSKQEHWSGVSFPPPGGLLDPGIEAMSLASPALAGTLSLHLYHLHHLGSSSHWIKWLNVGWRAGICSWDDFPNSVFMAGQSTTVLLWWCGVGNCKKIVHSKVHLRKVLWAASCNEVQS